jgi:hypothetical protein
MYHGYYDNNTMCVSITGIMGTTTIILCVSMTGIMDTITIILCVSVLQVACMGTTTIILCVSVLHVSWVLQQYYYVCQYYR